MSHLAASFGNAAASGFGLKGAFLSTADVQAEMDTYLNCRAPASLLDFGEVRSYITVTLPLH